jgi:23S rRNA (guanine745-N1)-methyltransferase
VTAAVLACSVRGCGLPLQPNAGALICARGHSYDIARSGYVNLLQPQDRRSRSAGDSTAAVEARSRLIASGVGRAVIDGVIEQAAALDLTGGAAVVDLGAGSGETLGALAERRPIAGVGIDLSPAAVTVAAKRYPALTWIVANADRRLPILDGSVELVLSVHGRRNPGECARILTRPGYLVAAVPAADDLVELREIVQGRRVERERAASLEEEHGATFRPIARAVVRETRRLSHDQLLDLLRGTYRGARTSAAGRVEALESLGVTLASDIRVLAVR